jgi:hypothetical protein
MKKKDEKKRYQECNIFIKLWRRLIYQIPYFILACCRFVQYQFFVKDTEVTAKLAFRLTHVEWQHKANWYYTYEEVFDEMTNYRKELQQTTEQNTDKSPKNYE